MEHKLVSLLEKDTKLVIGMMTGTSADGIDVVLTKISQHGTATKVKQLAFVTYDFPPALRGKILKVAGGEAISAEEYNSLHFLLGDEYAKACATLCKSANVDPKSVDLVGIHGQTIHHQPTAVSYLGSPVRGTLQIGEPSAIAEALDCIVVSDFRPRDMAAGGQGAPLVPYTDFILYRREDKSVALQNIGGIGNIAFIPKNGTINNVVGFDTGPGNMLLDSLMIHFTKGEKTYDDGGSFGATGKVDDSLLEYLMDDEYLRLPPPKSTGREKYNDDYLKQLLMQSKHLSPADIMATATFYTANTIVLGIHRFLPAIPDQLIIGGGGSHNKTMLAFLAELLPDCEVLTNEDIGFDSDSKEAVAFAVLANEAIHGNCNNAPKATGASHAVVMGKITY